MENITIATIRCQHSKYNTCDFNKISIKSLCFSNFMLRWCLLNLWIVEILITYNNKTTFQLIAGKGCSKVLLTDSCTVLFIWKVNTTVLKLVYAFAQMHRKYLFLNCLTSTFRSDLYKNGNDEILIKLYWYNFLYWFLKQFSKTD